MNIQKLKSGSYRIRLTENGKSYSITVPYKPTTNEAYKLIRQKIDNPTNKYETFTFKEASEEYCKEKHNVLSPSTARDYKKIRNNIPDWFNNLQLKQIDTAELQKYVNEYATNHAPKTTSNVCSFVKTVIRHFLPDKVYHITLPQKSPKKPYIPTEKDVKRLLEYAKGTEYYICLCLSSLSLRRSEWTALTIDDVEGDVIHIRRAKVKDDNETWIVKDYLKNDTSYRDIYISDELAQAIREKGYLYIYSPDSIYQFMKRACKDLDIPYFSVHKLRHFFASYCHGKFTDKQIMSMGGWKTDTVLRNIYTHAMEEEKAKKKMTKKIGSLF